MYVPGMPGTWYMVLPSAQPTAILTGSYHTTYKCIHTGYTWNYGFSRCGAVRYGFTEPHRTRTILPWDVIALQSRRILYHGITNENPHINWGAIRKLNPHRIASYDSWIKPCLGGFRIKCFSTTAVRVRCGAVITGFIILQGPQPRFGGKLLKNWVVCPPNGTAVLKVRTVCRNLTLLEP